MTDDIREVIFFENDQPAARRYGDAFISAGLQMFRMAFLPARRLISEPGFDALYWTLPAAERWNVRPIEDVIQVIRTSAEDQSEGWPERLLVGLALSRANASDKERALRTWAQALLAAMDSSAGVGIVKVKVPAEMVALSELSPERVAAILSDVERGNVARA